MSKKSVHAKLSLQTEDTERSCHEHENVSVGKETTLLAEAIETENPNVDGENQSEGADSQTGKGEADLPPKVPEFLSQEIKKTVSDEHSKAATSDVDIECPGNDDVPKEALFDLEFADFDEVTPAEAEIIHILHDFIYGRTDDIEVNALSSESLALDALNIDTSGRVIFESLQGPSCDESTSEVTNEQYDSPHEHTDSEYDSKVSVPQDFAASTRALLDNDDFDLLHMDDGQEVSWSDIFEDVLVEETSFIPDNVEIGVNEKRMTEDNKIAYAEHEEGPAHKYMNAEVDHATGEAREFPAH